MLAPNRKKGKQRRLGKYASTTFLNPSIKPLQKEDLFVFEKRTSDLQRETRKKTLLECYEVENEFTILQNQIIMIINNFLISNSFAAFSLPKLADWKTYYTK
jgi:hypothetical protein